MALSEVYGVALEAQEAVKSVAEVLGRLSTALHPSNQLMSAWMQERDVLYRRIEQLEQHAQELQAAIEALRQGTQAAQNELAVERQQLEHLRQQHAEERRQLEQEREALELQQRQLEQQRLILTAQAQEPQAKEAQARQQAQLRSPGSDSDVSLPPSQPRVRPDVDRVPETLFLGWGDELLDDGAPGAAGVAGVERREAEGVGNVMGEAPHASAPGTLSPHTIGTGAASLGQVATYDSGAEALAAAQAAWAAREQQLTQDFAAQLQAVWAENNALQADLQSALAYRRTAHELRSSNQALQHQLQELQQHLQEARSAAEAAVVALPAPPPPPRVSVATSPLRAAPPLHCGPEHNGDAHVNPAPHAGGAAIGGGLIVAAAVEPSRESAADVAALTVAKEALETQLSSLAAERDRLLAKHRETRQACREAKQVARHWQNAYWGLMAAHGGPEAVTEATRHLGANANAQPPEADAAAAGQAQLPAAVAGEAAPKRGRSAVEAGGPGNRGCSRALGGVAAQCELVPRWPAEEESRGAAGPAIQQPAELGVDASVVVRVKEEEVPHGQIGIKEEPVWADQRRLGPAPPVPDGALGPGRPSDERPGELLRPGAGLEHPDLRPGPARGRALPYPSLHVRLSETHADWSGAAGARAVPDQRAEAVPALGGNVEAEEGSDDPDEMDLTQEPSDGGACADGGAGRGGFHADEPTPGSKGRQPPPQPPLPQHPRGDREAAPDQDQPWRHVPGGAPCIGVSGGPALQQQHQQQALASTEAAAEDRVPASGLGGGAPRLGASAPMPLVSGAARRSSSDGAAAAALDRGQGQVATSAAAPGPSGGGGWLNKRSRSWDMMDAEGTAAVSDGGASGGGGSGGGSGGGGGGISKAGVPRPEKVPPPGRRYVQQQLPAGWQRPPAQPAQQQQCGSQPPRRQRTPPSQQLAEHGVTLETVRQAALPAAAQPAAVAAGFSDDDDFVLTGETPARPPQDGPAPQAAPSAADAAGGGSSGGGAPLPRKRKATGPAGATLTGAGAVAPAAAGQRPPKAPGRAASPGLAPCAPGLEAGPVPPRDGAAGAASEAAADHVGAARGAAGRAGVSGGGDDAAGGGASGGGGGGAGERGEPGYKYTAVVRGRVERDALQAVECAGCKAFYDAIATWGDAVEVQPSCHHVQQRAQGARAAGANTAAAAATAAAARKGVPQPQPGQEQQVQQQPQQPQRGQQPQAGNMASALRQAGGRHRFKYAPPATPEGFWDLGFGDTQD